MQGVGLRIEGYLNGDPSQTFLFTTELDEEQSHVFAQPLVVDEPGSYSADFRFDHHLWFQDQTGLIDPNEAQLSSSRSTVETNIVNSFDVY